MTRSSKGSETDRKGRLVWSQESLFDWREPRTLLDPSPFSQRQRGQAQSGLDRGELMACCLLTGRMESGGGRVVGHANLAEVTPISKSTFLDSIVGFTCVDGVIKKNKRRGNFRMVVVSCPHWPVKVVSILHAWCEPVG